ncbi:hypothetical protein Glove_689g17 [Diversispora epigaea]|uniref:Uncharacterized protein n=1 Tax=Diversispora epigaea TaxID=1348612 RepID=A0A397G2E5_9GLOM|nr:hypothetical protein Glove_689g17 [Diversispora epigaea]
MLNIALLSGNDYYWTKLIIALNLIYISRFLSYLKDVSFYSAFYPDNIRNYSSLISYLIFVACRDYENTESKFLKLHKFLKYGNIRHKAEISQYKEGEISLQAIEI